MGKDRGRVMYRVLLVDDEALELEALKNYVDWEGMGMEVAGTARNGRDAWEKILAGEPDVVITDIQMPVMDGITLAGKIVHLNRQIRIVFLTGYDEVEYLKAAIKVSASDYILKPFSDEAVRAAMEKVRGEMEKEALMQNSLREGRSALIRKACMGAGPSGECLERLRQLGELEQEGDWYGIMQFYGISVKSIAMSLENQLSEILSVWQEERRLTVVVKGYVHIRDCAGRISGLLMKLADLPCNGVYFERRVSGSGLREAYRVLESCEEHMFYREQQELLGVGWEAEDRGHAAGYVLGQADRDDGACVHGGAVRHIQGQVEREDGARVHGGAVRHVQRQVKREDGARVHGGAAGHIQGQMERDDGARVHGDGIRYAQGQGDRDDRGCVYGDGSRHVQGQADREEPDRQLTDRVRRQLTESIMAGNREGTEAAAALLFDAFVEGRIARPAVIRCLDKLLYQIERMCMIERSREEMRRLLQHTMDKVEKAVNIGQIREAVLEYLRAMAAYNAEDIPDTGEYVVQKVKEYIHRNYAVQFTSADLAGEIHLSQNYIRSIFKEGTGKTVLEYLTEYRFEKAGELLRRAGAKVKEVSVAVGYENVPYFCTLFTRIYGMTPGEYHKKYQN